VNLTGRHILITGASRGIGLALARECRDRGARVTMLASNPEGIAKAAAEVGGTPLVADLSDLDSLARVLPDAEAANGPVDVLVNNAARMGMGPLARLDAATLRGVLTTNFLAPAELSRAAAASMVPRRTGVIVAVSSLAGEMALRNVPAYGSSKAGLSYLTRALQRELAGTGVLAQLVLLGGVDTELLRENQADPVAGPASARLAKVVPVPGADVVGRRIAEHIESGRRRTLVLPAAARGAVALRHSLTSLSDLLLKGLPRSL
jgi:NAD(P)-dependent dehydrogenase (short-subunit alcohol dehydrogenase family)